MLAPNLMAHSYFLCISAAIATSVLIDSYYWRRWLWPELEVLWFNTLKRDADGRMFTASSAWGTEPFHWYFARALPKALLAALLLIPVAIVKRVPATLTEVRANPRALFQIDRDALSVVSLQAH